MEKRREIDSTVLDVKGLVDKEVKPLVLYKQQKNDFTDYTTQLKSRHNVAKPSLYRNLGDKSDIECDNGTKKEELDYPNPFAAGIDAFSNLMSCQYMMFMTWFEAADRVARCSIHEKTYAADDYKKHNNEHGKTASNDFSALCTGIFEEEYTRLFTSEQFLSRFGTFVNCFMKAMDFHYLPNRPTSDNNEIHFIEKRSDWVCQLPVNTQHSANLDSQSRKNTDEALLAYTNKETSAGDKNYGVYIKHENKHAAEQFLAVQNHMLHLCQRSLLAWPLVWMAMNSKEDSQTDNEGNSSCSSTTPRELVFQKDKVKVLLYRSKAKRTHSIPVVLVYAMVNRPTILDAKGKSAIGSLVDQGFDVFLVDWGDPGAEERTYSIDDYVNGYMDTCVDCVRKYSKSEQVHLLGYCMGGTLSVIYSCLHSDKVRNLITIATPFDCSKDNTVFGSLSRFIDADAIVNTVGNIPPDFQYVFFRMLKPFKHFVQRYADMADKKDDKIAVEQFMESERWLWDTPAIPGEMFRQWVKEIYQRNLLAENKLGIGDQVADTRDIGVPLLTVVAEYDHLVSPHSSIALSENLHIKDNTLLTFPTGHIGLCASRYAITNVWNRIGEWLRDRT